MIKQSKTCLSEIYESSMSTLFFLNENVSLSNFKNEKVGMTGL